MKKFAIATLLAASAIAASAAEFGVFGTRDYAGTNRNSYGVSVGTNVGGLGLTGSAERATFGTNDQDRYAVVVSKDLFNVGTVRVAGKVGGAYLNNQTGDNGYAAVVGVGATLPVTKTVALGVDVVRQYGQDRVQAYDGNRVTAGLKYSF